MLLGVDGYEVLKKIKDEHISVIFMTARSNITDKIFGLKLGADDYITKPFEPMELLARVGANLRMQKRLEKKIQNHLDDKIKYEDIIISPSERKRS